LTRVVVLVTARPSWARIQTALEAMPAAGLSPLVLLAGSACASDYGDIRPQVESLALPYECLHGRWQDDHPAGMAVYAGQLTERLADAFRRLRPDGVLVLCDRHEVLAGAIAARYQNIPLAHLQGGEVTGSVDDCVRDAITQLADLHLVASNRAYARVYAMRPAGRNRTIVQTGCPSVDLAHRAVWRSFTDLHAELHAHGTGAEIDITQPYAVLMQHPDTTTWGDADTQMEHTVSALQASGLPVVAFWPNIDAGRERVARVLRTTEAEAQWRHMRHVAPEVFYRLIHRAAVLVGNSSVGIREAAALGVKVVNVGDRQAGRERGRNVKDVGYDSAAILRGIRAWQAVARPLTSDIYGDGEAGPKVAQAMAQWVGVSKREVA
jgi:UDP-hydrolysing UDP-N-acetyl-D-glucosamine 2-epimerase